MCPSLHKCCSECAYFHDKATTEFVPCETNIYTGAPFSTFEPFLAWMEEDHCVRLYS